MRPKPLMPILTIFFEVVWIFEGGRTRTNGEALDLMTIDHKDVVLGEIGAALLGIDFFLRLALSGVVFDEVGEIVSRNEVVHGDDLDLLAEQALITDCTKHEASDAPETIDADFDHVL